MKKSVLSYMYTQTAENKFMFIYLFNRSAFTNIKGLNLVLQLFCTSITTMSFMSRFDKTYFQLRGFLEGIPSFVPAI